MSNFAERNFLNTPAGWKSWLVTLDHKRIGLMYLYAIMTFLAVGGLIALAIRLELLNPGSDFVTADIYNRLFTLHGAIMIFLFIIPSIPAALGNIMLPVMIGAKDVALPRLNLLSWYIFCIGAFIALYSILKGGVDTGWTFYTPYSSSTETAVIAMTWRIYPGILINIYRYQLYCDNPQIENAWFNLVQASPIRLGIICYCYYSGTGHTRCCDHPRIVNNGKTLGCGNI